jgi:hypothetical protein
MRTPSKGLLALMCLFLLPQMLPAQTPTPAPIHRLSLAVIALAGDPVTAPALQCGAAPNLTPCIATLGITAPTSAPCNQPPRTPAGPNPVNPRTAQVDDPFTGGRACDINFPPNIPDGQYRIVTYWESDNCVTPPATTGVPCAGARSGAVGPFTVVSPRLPPSAPTGPRILAMLWERGRALLSCRSPLPLIARPCGRE